MAYRNQKQTSPSPAIMECEIDLETPEQSAFGSKPKPGTKRYSRRAFRQSKKRRKSCNTKRTKSLLFGL